MTSGVAASSNPLPRVLVLGNVIALQQMTVWRELARLGFDIHFAGSRENFGNDLYGEANLAPIQWGHLHVMTPRGIRSRGHTWWLYPGLKDLIRRVRPSLVHVLNEPWGLGLVQVVLSRPPVPVVLHPTSSGLTEGQDPKSCIRRTLSKALLRQVSGVIAGNELAMQSVNELIPEVAVRAVAMHAVPDPGLFAVASDRSVAKHVVGYVGRLSAEKGVDVLIDAVRALKRKDIELRVVGSGPEMNALIERARDVQDVSFVGAVPPEDVPSAMAAFDLLVVPSRSTQSWREYFGRAAVEGMLMGLPVIASDSGSLPSVLGGAGIIVQQDDPVRLAEAISRLLDDPAERAAMARRCRHRARQEYSPRSVAREIAGAWRNLLAPTLERRRA